MKILLLNQPVYNRGDEAAHRSLIRTINNSIPNALITIVLENTNEFLPIFSRKLKGNKLEIMYIVNIPKRDNMMKKAGEE